ncbi:MAG: hypothetical protein H7Z43_14180 [Clostridia bacterium]|nr:hypothetical protein [Deltaproteobacteria bacterium]
MNDPRLLRLVNLYQLAAAIVMATTAVFIARDRALAVFCGGLLMAANFWSIRELIKRTLQPGGLRALYAVGLMLKFFAVMGVMAALLLVANLDALGFMIGLCSLFLGVTAGMTHMSVIARSQASAQGI